LSLDVAVEQPSLVALAIVHPALGRLVADISDEPVLIVDVLLLLINEIINDGLNYVINNDNNNNLILLALLLILSV